MTAREAMEAWDSLGEFGRLVFLLKSWFMKEEYPKDNEPFFVALERFKEERFEDLPGELQDEFLAFVNTPSYGIWMRKKGGERCEGHI